ncbi:hypothetical protein HMPREF3201_02294 [Megasphaera sp. MJR8396C]|nr:hypothetical protein HMPREF3201_02294 [Megasphaera sp. MJR8396C]
MPWPSEYDNGRRNRKLGNKGRCTRRPLFSYIVKKVKLCYDVERNMVF